MTVTPSLAPYEDAVRRIDERSGPDGDDPMLAALRRSQRFCELEMARLMDAGHGTEMALDFVGSLAASMLDTVASSAVSETESGEPDTGKRAALLAIMLAGIRAALFDPAARRISDVETIHYAQTGRA